MLERLAPMLRWREVRKGGHVMSKRKAAKAKAVRGIRNLPAKKLSADQARGVKGGKPILMD
jgi:hypothetical protein